MLNNSVKAVTSSSLIDGFALGSDDYIFKNLNQLLKAKGLERQRQRYFAILTAPVHQSFMAEAEIKLLQIGLEIKKHHALIKFIKNASLADIEKKLKKYSEIFLKLNEYQQNHFWTRNNYVDNNVLSLRFFLKELLALVKQDVDFEREIKRLAQIPRQNKRAKQKLMKELNLPTYFKNLLVISEDFTYWQDQRKKKTYWYTHYLSLILAEMGRRFGFSLLQMKYFLYPEILSLFGENIELKPAKAELNRRIKSCLWYQVGDAFDLSSGPEADKILLRLLKRDKKEIPDDFRGMSASKGVASGRVCLMKSVKDSHKIKPGDVLVAVMTRPDYIPAIKKAIAIVTNEGGVTCHAAIVSRELGIPCVIGTKIATEVLKDGMIVEVNANHGVVKIIK